MRRRLPFLLLPTFPLRTFLLPFAVSVLLPTTLTTQSAHAGVFTEFLTMSGRAIAKRTEVKDGRRYVKVNPSVEDLDLKTLSERLKLFGIVFPFSLEGKVSARVTVEVPIGSPRNAKLYRVQGTVASDRLIIDGFEIRNLLGSLSYGDGVAKLDQLTFLIPHGQGSGRVSGNASLNVLPVEDLCGTLSLDSLPLSSIKELWTDVPDIEGRATGQLEFCVADAEIRRIDAWSASGEIKAEPLELEPLSLDQLTAKLKLAKSRLQAHDIVAAGYAATLQGAVNLELRAPFPLTGRATFRSANLQKNVTGLAPAIAGFLAKGTASAELQFEGALDPLKYGAEGTAQVDKLLVAGRLIERIEAELALDQNVFQLTEFQATAFGGKLQGSAVFNHQTLEMATEARIQELEIAQILPSEFANRWQLAGETGGSASLRIPAGAFRKPDEWSGSARLNVEEIALGGTTRGQLTAAMSLTQGDLQFATLTGRVAGLNVDASGRIGVSQPFEFSARVDAQTPDAAAPTALLPFGIRGRVELNADAKGQWQPRRFQIDGKLTAEKLVWNNFALEQIQTEGRATQESLSVQKLTADLYGGRVNGLVEIPIPPPQAANPPAAGRAELAWSDVDLAELLTAQGLDAVRPGAEFSGTLTASVPAGAWRTPESWTATAEVELADLQLQDGTTAVNGTAVNGTVKARYDEASIRVTEFLLRAGRQSLSGTGRIATVAPYRWQTSTDARNLELETVLPFVALPELAELSGIVSATGDFQGTLESLQMTGQGRVTAETLQFGALEGEKVRFDLIADEQTVSVTNAEASVLDGRLKGSAQWPWTPQGTITLDASWTDLSIGPLFHQFRDEFPAAAIEVGGLAGGTLHARVPRDKLTQPFRWNGSVKLDGTDLTLNEREIGSFTANLDIEDQAIGYSFDAELLSGHVDAKGDWSPEQNLNSGTLNARKMAIGDLLSLLEFEALSQFEGQATLQVQYRHGGPLLLEQASGSVSVIEPSWNGTLISPLLAGSLAWTENRLTVQDLSGPFSGGQLRADLGVSVGSEPKGTYSVSLLRADLENAVSTWTDFDGDVSGTIDLRLQGAVSEELRGSGRLTAQQVRYRLPFNQRIVELGNWRVPMRTSYARDRLRIDVVRASGTPFNSRSTADVSLTVNQGVRVEGKAKYSRANLPQILHGLGRTGQAGRGFLSGTLNFSGRNIKSLNDLEMTIDSRLGQTQATTVPLLPSLQPFLSAAIPLTEIFQTGQLRGRLKNSVFRIERLSLNGHRINLYALGTVTLAGRLDLDVTADTGRLTEDRLLSRALVSQLLTVASPPVALLVRANQFLQDRVVHLTATGTLRNPRIQVRPLESLTEEAIRFFLLQAVE